MDTYCQQCGQPLDVEFESSQGICLECQRLSEGLDISQLGTDDEEVDLFYDPEEERCPRCEQYNWEIVHSCFNHGR